MSIATDMKVVQLEKRIVELEQKFMGMTKIELLAHMAQLELRIEQLEQQQQRGKPKKESANG